jgi:hypothetical protein
MLTPQEIANRGERSTEARTMEAFRDVPTQGTDLVQLRGSDSRNTRIFGLDTFVLSGYPRLEEAHHLVELRFARLPMALEAELRKCLRPVEPRSDAEILQNHER